MPRISSDSSILFISSFEFSISFFILHIAILSSESNASVRNAVDWRAYAARTAVLKTAALSCGISICGISPSRCAFLTTPAQNAFIVLNAGSLSSVAAAGMVLRAALSG